MEKHSTMTSTLRAWFNEFGSALDGWESWLARVEQAYVTGEFQKLQDLEGESEAILWQACSFAPLGAADRYELLCCVGAPQRTTALLRMLDDAIDTFSHRLRLG